MKYRKQNNGDVYYALQPGDVILFEYIEYRSREIVDSSLCINDLVNVGTLSENVNLYEAECLHLLNYFNYLVCVRVKSV